jgi:predicted translin family RNA/ssDNA-binding protein
MPILTKQNDRLERLVKISRDITIGSKRIIFLLHRISNQSEDEIQQQASESLKSVRENIVRVIEELGAEPYYRYQRAFSPGLQEYIEAASFLHYLLTRTLITPEQLLQDVLDLVPMKVRACAAGARVLTRVTRNRNRRASTSFFHCATISWASLT